MNPLENRSRASLRAVLLAILAEASVATAPVTAGVVGGEIVARVGQENPPTAKGVDLPDGSVITFLRHPTVDALGRVGFTGRIETAKGVRCQFVWQDDKIVFVNNTECGDDITGQVSGHGAGGEFVYDTRQIGGADALRYGDGVNPPIALLATGDDVGPNPGNLVEESRYPKLRKQGEVVEVYAQMSVLPGGFTAVYRWSSDTLLWEQLLAEGTTVDGMGIFGVWNIYGVSDNSDYRIHKALIAPPVMGFGDAIYMRHESGGTNQFEPLGPLDISPIADVAINNNGKYAAVGIFGDTSTNFLAIGDFGSEPSYHFVSGDVKDCVLLSNLMSVAINNDDQVLLLWQTVVGGMFSAGALFIGDASSGAPPFEDTVRKIVAPGDTLVTPDRTSYEVGQAVWGSCFQGCQDARIDLENDADEVYALVELADDVGAFQAIARFPLSTCVWDLDNDGMVGIVDLLALLAAWGPGPCDSPDFDGDGDVGIVDLLALLAHWGPCP